VARTWPFDAGGSPVARRATLGGGHHSASVSARQPGGFRVTSAGGRERTYDELEQLCASGVFRFNSVTGLPPAGSFAARSTTRRPARNALRHTQPAGTTSALLRCWRRMSLFINLFGFGTVPAVTGRDVANLVGCWRWLRLEGLVPPPVGAFAGGSGAGCHRGWGLGWWARQRSRAQWLTVAVDDRQGVRGPGDGDDAAMVQPVVVEA
jgi:hypothetical protein